MGIVLFKSLCRNSFNLCNHGTDSHARKSLRNAGNKNANGVVGEGVSCRAAVDYMQIKPAPMQLGARPFPSLHGRLGDHLGGQ